MKILPKILLILVIFILLPACSTSRSPMGHTPQQHEEFWNNEVHRGHDMNGHGDHPEAGHDFECIANGYLLEHCKE